MYGVRSKLARVQRLEEARAAASPFERAFGSLGTWEDACRAAGMDPRDLPAIILAVRGWHADRAWARR